MSEQLHLWGSGGGPAKPRERKPRERDALWDALTFVCKLQTSTMTTSSRAITNRALKELRDAGATPEEVLRRSRVYVDRFRSTPTAQGLARQWPGLAESPLEARSVPREVKPLVPPQRLAQLASAARAWIEEKR